MPTEVTNPTSMPPPPEVTNPICAPTTEVTNPTPVPPPLRKTEAQQQPSIAHPLSPEILRDGRLSTALLRLQQKRVGYTRGRPLRRAPPGHGTFGAGVRGLCDGGPRHGGGSRGVYVMEDRGGRESMMWTWERPSCVGGGSVVSLRPREPRDRYRTLGRGGVLEWAEGS